jgi:hypothetical protein
VATPPTIHIVASDEFRNGKTLLARCLADYLMLDRRDPFLIDTDTPDGNLRDYFPGRTQLANFAKVQGQIKIFDAILASPGRDYVIDLTAKHTNDFLQDVAELNFFAEARKLEFRTFLFFIVDQKPSSATLARHLQKSADVDLFIPVINRFVGSTWTPENEALILPALDQNAWREVSTRRFSFRSFVLGDTQNLRQESVRSINQFVYDVMQGLSNIETEISLRNLRT